MDVRSNIDKMYIVHDVLQLTFKVFEGICSVKRHVIHKDDDVLASVQKASIVKVGHEIHHAI